MNSNSNDDPMAAEFKKRTFSELQTFPNFSNLKKTEQQGNTEEGNRALKRQLTRRSYNAVDRAIQQAATSLSRVNSLSDDPNQFLFDKNPSTGDRVKNIKDRRTLLEIAARIRSEGVEIPQENTKVTFNDTVLSSEIPRVPGADISVASNQALIDRVDIMDTVEKLSSYLAEKLYLIDASKFSEQNLFDLLNYCDDREAGASVLASASLANPAGYRKSYKQSVLACDSDAPFTEANLQILQKYDLLQTTLDKTVQKIQQRQNSLSGMAASASKKLTDYINKIRTDIWIAFTSILNSGSSNGGRKTRRSKRISSSKRSTLRKRRTSKRRSSKRRSSKRRTLKKR